MKIKVYKTYYSGVSEDNEERYFTVSDSVDGLSCELLAEPRVITFETDSVREAIKKGMDLAWKYRCAKLEWNTSSWYFVRDMKKYVGKYTGRLNLAGISSR